MVECEDSNTPTWSNMVEGQLSILRDAVTPQHTVRSPEERRYRLNAKDGNAAGPTPRLGISRKNTAGRWQAVFPVPFSILRLVFSYNAAKLLERGHRARTLLAEDGKPPGMGGSGTTGSSSAQKELGIPTARFKANGRLLLKRSSQH